MKPLLLIPRHRAAFAVLAIALATAAGCANANKLQQPIGKLRVANAELAGTARPYFLELNRTERRLRFVDAENDKSVSVDATFFTNEYSAEGIQLRLEALQLLDAYFARLAEVAGSDATARLEANSNALTASLSSLGTRIGAASGDATISNYAGPVGLLVSGIGTIWIEQRRSEVLRKAIADVAPQVDKLLGLLETDLVSAYGSRRVALLQEIVVYRNAYNGERAGLSTEQRQARLSRLENLAARYDELSSIAPHSAFGEMRQAHNALVEAAKHLDSTQSFEAFVQAVEVLARHVDGIRMVVNGFKTTAK